MRFLRFLKKYLLILPIGALIIFFAIRNGQSFIKTLPTLITLVVQVLVVSAKRSAFLLGGLNSVLYGIAHLLDGLYFSAISAFAISAPIQLVSYFLWKKNSRGQRVVLRTCAKRGIFLTLMILLLGWVGCYFVLAPFFEGAQLPLLDSLAFVIGLIATVQAALRYVEAQYLNLINCTITLVLWVLIALENPASLNYVIISGYNVYRVAEASVSWTRKYRAQNALN